MIKGYKKILKIFQLLNCRVGTKVESFVGSFTPDIEKCFSTTRKNLDLITDDKSSWMYNAEGDAKVVTYMNSVNEVSAGDKEIIFNLKDDKLKELDDKILTKVADYTEVQMIYKADSYGIRCCEYETETLFARKESENEIHVYLAETNSLYQDRIIGKAVINLAEKD